MYDAINTWVAIVVAVISLVGLIITVIDSRGKDRQRKREIEMLQQEVNRIRNEVYNFFEYKIRDIVRAVREELPSEGRYLENRLYDINNLLNHIETHVRRLEETMGKIDTQLKAKENKEGD